METTAPVPKLLLQVSHRSSSPLSDQSFSIDFLFSFLLKFFCSEKFEFLQLISSAFQRCRLSEDLCRLSVLLDQSTNNDPPITCISSNFTLFGPNFVFDSASLPSLNWSHYLSI